MPVEGVEGVYLETHNWGKTAKFLQTLGYSLEFASDEGSSMFRRGDSPYLVVQEVPENQPPQTQVILKVLDADAFHSGADLEVVTAFEETHYNTREMAVRDPDGRIWSLQAPAKN